MARFWVFLIFEHNEHQVEEAERMLNYLDLNLSKRKQEDGNHIKVIKYKKETSKGNEIKYLKNKNYQNKSVNDYEKLIDEHGILSHILMLQKYYANH